VYHPWDTPQRPARPRYLPGWGDTLRKEDAPALNDQTPYNMLSTTAVKALNHKLRREGKEEVSVAWFRPNVVIKPDLEGDWMKGIYPEDGWKGYVK